MSTTTTTIPADVLAKLDKSQLQAAAESGAITPAQLIAEVERRNAKPVRELVYKVSDKGALSVYGLNRQFPTTLYRAQWERLDSDEERKRRADFIRANAGKLATK